MIIDGDPYVPNVAQVFVAFAAGRYNDDLVSTHDQLTGEHRHDTLGAADPHTGACQEDLHWAR